MMYLSFYRAEVVSTSHMIHWKLWNANRVQQQLDPKLTSSLQETGQWAPNVLILDHKGKSKGKGKGKGKGKRHHRTGREGVEGE